MAFYIKIVDGFGFTKGKEYKIIGISNAGFVKVIDDNGNEDWIGEYMVLDKTVHKESPDDKTKT